jgi:hypothetical protein
MTLEQWAIKNHVSFDALHELREMLGLNGADVPDDAVGKSEAYAQSVVRLEAAKRGIRLWRNNVGVLNDDTGRPVRYGLANDSKEVNRIIKSADLIGIRPVLITQAHVGSRIGQFVSREVKKPGWRYTGADREAAQLAWAQLILSLGGDAGFATGEGSL